MFGRKTGQAYARLASSRPASPLPAGSERPPTTPHHTPHHQVAFDATINEDYIAAPTTSRRLPFAASLHRASASARRRAKNLLTAIKSRLSFRRHAANPPPSRQSAPAPTVAVYVGGSQAPSYTVAVEVGGPKGREEKESPLRRIRQSLGRRPQKDSTPRRLRKYLEDPPRPARTFFSPRSRPHDFTITASTTVIVTSSLAPPGLPSSEW